MTESARTSASSPPRTTSPSLECDVIMKGGITSGIIYPGVVHRLAGTYRLRSIGGASAGAIAAAAAAAAEFGRSAGGFEKLAQLPAELAGESLAGGSQLFQLFQPQPATVGLYRLFTAALTRRPDQTGLAKVRGLLLRTIAIGMAAARAVPLWVLAGTAPGALLVLGSILGGTGYWRWIGFALALLLLVVSGLAATLTGLLLLLGRRIPRNYLGLCTGMPKERSTNGPALTPWLHERLQSFAGQGAGAAPLTFGDLANQDIELTMMTTNLTRRQPMTMPWSAREYWFNPAEWSDLFPEDVVEWLENHPPPVPDEPAARFRSLLLRSQAGIRHAGRLRPLPAAKDVPVIVATRMSLSFPLLISAVPLYAVDFTLTANSDASAAATRWWQVHLTGTPEEAVEGALGTLPAPEFTRNWFSDGGICSNMPVHFFDHALPTRPTFAIDLADFPAGRTRSDNEAENSYLPTVNQGGANRRWAPWPTDGLNALKGFGQAIVDSARVWVDQAQLVMPGFRDRVVTIFHEQSEGGMNLSMPPDVLQRLAKRGDAAAEKLVHEFAGPPPFETTGKGWDNHRWIRFRTATSGLEAWLADFCAGYTAVDPSPVQYSSWTSPTPPEPQPSYPIGGGRRRVLNQRTDDLLNLSKDWATQPAELFANGAPSPRPILKLTPASGSAQLDASNSGAGASPLPNAPTGSVSASQPTQSATPPGGAV